MASTAQVSSEVNVCAPDNSLDTVLINSNASVPYPFKEEGQECMNDSGTSFCFVGIKMKEPDDYESESESFTNSETKYSSVIYPSNHESQCNVDDQYLEGTLSNTSCIKLKMECEEDFTNCKSDFQTNDVSVTIDENSKCDCRSVVCGCDMGHSSNEFIRGIECQEYPILRVKDEEETTDKPIAVNKRNSVFRGNSFSLDTEDKKKFEEQETLRSEQGGTILSPEKNYEVKCNPSVEEGFSCDIRHPVFVEGKSLKGLTNVRISQNRFFCYICGKYFREKKKLEEHIGTHPAQKSFSCKVCKAGFTCMSHLQRHIRTHTGEKPFSCDVCVSTFTEKSHLNKHMLTHTGEKPFYCDICKASFSRKSVLKQHIRTHTGEKPFSCYVCKASFSQKGNLKSHMRTHFGDKAISCVV